MTNCWSEGALRAWLDRELPAEDMKAVAAHLGECSACDAQCTELAARASRVFSMLEMLGEPAPAVKLRPVPSRTPSRWLWPGAAVALAAGLAIASFIAQKQAEQPDPVAQVQPVVPAAPIQIVEPAPGPVAHSAVAKTSPRRPAAKPAGDYFLALDNEPIESGVIMRVALQPGNAQADIVFDPGGRARAIRLVSNKY
jgi:anti-sigma factor RsiW